MWSVRLAKYIIIMMYTVTLINVFFSLVEANVVDHVMDDHAASTSHHHHSPSKKNVEISITVPGAKKRKKGWYVASR